MRRTIGTRIDAALLRRMKDFARRKGCSLGDVIEEALSSYITRCGSRVSIVEQTRGLFRVSEAMLRTVLKEDLL